MAAQAAGPWSGQFFHRLLNLWQHQYKWRGCRMGDLSSSVTQLDVFKESWHISSFVFCFFFFSWTPKPWQLLTGCLAAMSVSTGVFWKRPQDISSHVCGDQKKHSKPDYGVFLAIIKWCLCLNLTRAWVQRDWTDTFKVVTEENLN